MATSYYANQYNFPYERTHNQEWELDKAANGTYVRAGWKGVPYDPPVRVKRDCGPFKREDLKVKNACEVTDIVVKNDRGHLKKEFKDPCGIPFYGNFRTTWDLPETILGPRERHVMGRRTAFHRPRCTAEEVPVGLRSCVGQWDNAKKARQDAKDIGAKTPFPEDMQMREIRAWEECAGRRMPYRVGKHTDALTISPTPRLKRWENWDPNHYRCRKLAEFCGKRTCPQDQLILIMAAIPPAKMPPPKPTKAELCLAKCLAKCTRSPITDKKGRCADLPKFRPVW